VCFFIFSKRASLCPAVVYSENTELSHFLEKNIQAMLKKRIDHQEQHDQQLEKARCLLRQHLIRMGLKQSAQRDTVLQVFLGVRDHISTEELHRLVENQDSKIGFTTVYRALKLFTECGLASEVSFRDGISRYEQLLNRRSHHHMVCTSCGESVEFFAPEIEAVQQAVGRKFHYAATSHTFQIYGLCRKCQSRQHDQQS
jgi:Fur family ferric uptake transcriptional regulator